MTRTTHVSRTYATQSLPPLQAPKPAPPPVHTHAPWQATPSTAGPRAGHARTQCTWAAAEALAVPRWALSPLACDCPPTTLESAPPLRCTGRTCCTEPRAALCTHCSTSRGWSPTYDLRQRQRSATAVGSYLAAAPRPSMEEMSRGNSASTKTPPLAEAASAADAIFCRDSASCARSSASCVWFSQRHDAVAMRASASPGELTRIA
jgi:hypothetical protein